MTVLMLVIAIFACVAVMAAGSRQLFAFARDQGVPFSSFFGHVSFGCCGFLCKVNMRIIDIPIKRDSPQCGRSHPNLCCPSLANQHWIRSGVHADYLAWCLSHADDVHDLHLLRRSQANSGRASPAFQVQPWKVGSANQHHCSGLPLLHLHIRLLANGTSPDRIWYELGDSDLWLYPHFRIHLLRSPRSAQVRGACRVYSQRIEGWKLNALLEFQSVGVNSVILATKGMKSLLRSMYHLIEA